MKATNDIARRPFLAGLAAFAGLAVVGGGLFEIFRTPQHHYKRTAFDDLLYKLPDRESARQLGVQVLQTDPSFTVTGAAQSLRAKLHHTDLAEALESDVRSGNLVDLRGWVIPRTLADLCALAAKFG